MKFYQRFLPYAVAIGSTAIALLLTFSVEPFLPRTIGAFFYIAIMVTAWYGGFRPGFVAVVLSTVAINYWFIPPRYQFWFERPEDLVQLTIFFLVAFLINLLTSNFRDSKQKIERLSQQLAQENAEQLRMALSAAQMGMWDWNIVTGEINWSSEHEQLFGLTPGTFEGKYETFDACLHPDDRKGLNQTIERSLKQRVPYQHEYRVVWADGSIHWIEARGQAFYDEAGQPVRMTGTVMAIDDRKQAETALQEREAILRLFVQYAPAGIAMFDRDMRYMLKSQRWVDDHYLNSIESLMNRSHYEIFPEIPERWRQIHQRCLAGAIEKCDEDL
ncbi:MAG TPA: PAS domain-containing protein, partial [Coleofasciculaceae cyanobacterium]